MVDCNFFEVFDDQRSEPDAYVGGDDVHQTKSGYYFKTMYVQLEYGRIYNLIQFTYLYDE